MTPFLGRSVAKGKLCLPNTTNGQCQTMRTVISHHVSVTSLRGCVKVVNAFFRKCTHRLVEKTEFRAGNFVLPVIVIIFAC